jgi:hypothetical protein
MNRLKYSHYIVTKLRYELPKIAKQEKTSTKKKDLIHEE